MSMHASIHGRCVFEPQERTTKAGKAMTTARLAVDVTGNGDEETLWLDLLAFGSNAETLARVTKGESVSAIGRITRSQYQDRNGNERESWSMLADAVLTVRSARPGSRAKAAQQPSSSPAANRASAAMQAPDFDDPMPF